jgi:hypothetical protein
MRLLSIFIATFILFSGFTSYAGFVVKKTHHIQTQKTVSPATTLDFSKATEQHWQMKLFPHLQQKIAMGTAAAFPRHRSSDGWPGIVALVCGVVCFPTTSVLLALLAIIFGAIGMARRRRNKGLAIAGFVLGILGLVFGLLALLFFLAFLSWW